jgi:hypothetical protein
MDHIIEEYEKEHQPGMLRGGRAFSQLGAVVIL